MTEIVVPVRFLVLGGTAANLASVDPVPKAREICIETDTLKWKLGDGVTAYNSLAYFGASSLPIENAGGIFSSADVENALQELAAALADKQSTIPFAVAGGSANALTADFTPEATLSDGMEIRLRATAANTGAATLAVDGGTARSITKLGGTSLAAGDISAAGHELQLRYRASTPRWELMNPAALTGTSSAFDPHLLWLFG